jgi:hypothetical protein
MPPSQVGDEDAEEGKQRAADAADTAGMAGESVAAGSGSDCDVGCDSCDGPDCGCDVLLFVRLSTLLLVVAALLPAVGCDRLVAASIRGYQRWLTRFTPSCPGSPSCSAYALAAVRRLGARRGLAAAACRVRHCG